MSQPIVLRKGSTFLDEDELLPGEAVWDHSDAQYARIGVGAGERGPRFYPGIDKFGNMCLRYGTTIRMKYPSGVNRKENEIGFDSTGAFIVKLDGTTIFRVDPLGVEFTGYVKQAAAASQFLQSDTGLSELLFPLYSDKTLMAQFNRPVFAGTDINNRFRAYRDTINFLFDFNSTFIRTQVGRPLFVGFNGAYALAEANQPRIVYDPKSLKCRGLLFEPPSTNLLLDSFDWTKWTNTGLFLIQDTPTPAAWAAKGLDAPYTFSENNTNTEHSLTHTFTGDVTKPFAFSFFIAPRTFTGNRRFTAFLSNSDRSHLFGVNINIISGLAPLIDTARLAGNGSVISSSIENVGRGIYRVKVAGNINPLGVSAQATHKITIASLGDDLTNDALVFTPDNNVAYWAYFDDAQVEQRSSVTSYMPASSVLSSRGADVLSLTLQGNFNFSVDEGLFEIKFRPHASMAQNIGAVIFSLQNGDGTTRQDYYLAAVNQDGSWTVGVKTYIAGTLTNTNASLATVSAKVVDLLVNYTNLPGVITKLVIDSTTGFSGTLNLISYE